MKEFLSLEEETEKIPLHKLPSPKCPPPPVVEIIDNKWGELDAVYSGVLKKLQYEIVDLVI